MAQGPRGMPNVFISYRRSDTSGYAGWIYERLAGVFGPHRIFIDVDSLVSRALSSWVKCGILCHGTNWTSQAGVGVE